VCAQGHRSLAAVAGPYSKARRGRVTSRPPLRRHLSAVNKW
jgi:hypothetical protein